MVDLAKDLLLFIGIPLSLILSVVDLVLSCKKNKVIKSMLTDILVRQNEERKANNNNQKSR